METKEFRYSAFISYKHLDKKAAKQIQNKLEYYRVPTKLCAQHGFYRRLKKCYRDIQQYGGGLLTDATIKAIRQCKFMIVVCSPNVRVNDQHINAEIDTFRKFYGDGKIIPVVIAGALDDPNAPNYPLPTALTEEGGLKHICINYKQDGKSIAWLKIIASILEIDADVLIKREKRRLLRKRILATLVATCLIAFTGIVVNFYTPKSKDFTDFVIAQNGEPIGIGELSTSQVQTMENHYTIVFQNTFVFESITDWVNIFSTHPQYEIRFENKYNQLTEPDAMYYPDERVPLIVIDHSNDSDAYSMTYCDVNGVQLTRYQFTADCRAADLTQSQYASRPSMVMSSVVSLDPFENDSETFQSKSDITRFSYEYTDQLISQITFNQYNRENTYLSNADGIFGMEYERNAAGQIEKIFFLTLGEDGSTTQRTTLTNGVYAKRYTYTSDAKLEKIENLDITGTPIYVQNIPPIYQIQYNSDGNPYSFDCLDKDGNHVLGTDGWASMVLTYEDHCIKTNYYDENGNPVLATDQKVAMIVDQYDEQSGRLEERAYYNAQGEPMVTVGAGVWRIRFSYEIRDEAVCYEESYDGIDGESILAADTGVAVIRQTLGEHKEEISFYDTLGEPTFHNQIGAAIILYTYNDEGILKDEFYYDPDCEPILTKDTGVAVVWRTFDEQSGNLIEESYYDTNNERIERSDMNVATIRWDYDLQGNVVKLSYYGADDELIISKEGIAGWAHTYENGNLTAVSYFDANGNPMLHPDYDAATIKYDYNERGNMINESFFGEDGEPKLSLLLNQASLDSPRLSIWNRLAPIASIEYTYDLQGNITSQAFYDLNGNLTRRTSSGFALITYTMDERGNQIMEIGYDIDGLTPINDDNGICIIKRSFDERNNKISEAYFDANGLPVLDSSYEVASIHWQYDAFGRLVEQSYRDGNDIPMNSYNGIASIKWCYDERGMMISESYFDPEGMPDLNHDTLIASVHWAYDDLGRQIEESYFNREGYPIVASGGIYAKQWAYNERSQLISLSYVDAEGNPDSARNSISIIGWKYDEVGRRIEEAYYGVDGNPIGNQFLLNCSVIKTFYDEQGNLIEEILYSIDGGIIPYIAGY